MTLIVPPSAAGGRARAGSARRARGRGSGRRGRHHDHVQLPGLVFEQQEGDAVRRRRALARDDHPGDGDPRAVTRSRGDRARRGCRAEARAGAGRAGGRRSKARSSGSRRAAAPRRIARARAAWPRSATGAGRAGAPSRPSPGRSCRAAPGRAARAAMRRGSPNESQAPAETSALSVRSSRPLRCASWQTSAKAPPRSRSATSAFAPASPSARTSSSPIRTAPSSTRLMAALAFTSTGSTVEAAALRIPHQRRRRVEAHRLGVEQRGQILGRVVVAQPGRLVAEQREGGGVRLGEAEAREAGQLVVDHVGRLGIDSLRGRAGDEALAVGLERLGAALAAHRPAQSLRLAHAEAGQRHRHLQHLVLEDDHPERLAQAAPRAADGRRAPRSSGRRAGARRCST